MRFKPVQLAVQTFLWSLRNPGYPVPLTSGISYFKSRVTRHP